MRKNILYAFLFVFLSFTLISCGMGNTVDETASNTNPDASIKELLSISAVSTGGTSYKFSPNIAGASASELAYKWTFGDGNESTDQSPTHKYSILGMKTVTLTTYKGEEIWKTTSIAINVTDAGSITGTDIIAKPEMDGVTYSFTSRAIAADGGDLNFKWDFNEVDGSVQEGTNLNNVSHEFYQYGRDYNVVLTVTNDANGDTTTTNTVVSTPNPTFSFDVTAGALPGSKMFIPNLSVDIPDAQFTWDFGDDNTTITTSKNPNAEHYYGKVSGTVNVKCTVNSSKLATPLEFTYENVNISIDFQLFGAAYEVTSTDQLTYKYSVKGAFQGEDTTKINNVSYRFIYPDGTKSNLIAGSPVQDGSSVIAGQSYAEDNHTYNNYMRSYNVKVEAVQVVEGKETVLGTLSEGLSHNYVTPQYTITSSTDANNPFIVNFAVGGEGFYPLKGAVYKWNFGDGLGEVSGSSSMSNTYTKNGTFNVTLKVTSPNVTFDNAYTANTTANVNESISNVSFSCNPTNTDEWLKYTCTTNATSSTGTLVYTWKVNNQVVPNNNKPTLEKTFDKYNTTYNVDLTVNISGTTISATATRQQVTTPRPVVEINGSSEVLSGSASEYNLTFKVTRNGREGNITFNSPTIRWNIGNQDRPQFNDQANISHTFIVNDNEDKTVVRTMNVTVGSSNMTGNITATKDVSVTKPTAEMSDVQNLRITCANDSAWNPVKQKCSVTFDLKATATNPDKNQFDVSIVDAGNLNKAQIVKQGVQAALILDWPELNITGKSTSRSFTITGKVYKPENPSDVLTVSTNVTVRNYIDYVLFPLPDNPTQGGTGTQIGVYSCGYNSFYGTGQGKIEKQGCNEGNSVSGKTLNLGQLVNANGQAKTVFTMKWGARIPNIGNVDIASHKLSVNGTVPDNMKKFNIANAFGSHKYAGDAYGNDNNGIFYLEVSGDTLSKPLKVWYNGNYKTDKGNRLRILAPIQETTDHSCKYSVSGKTINGSQLYVKFRSPYFNNGSGQLQLMFGGSYRTDTNQTRSIYGFGPATIDNNNQTIGIKTLFYTENDSTVNSITANNVSITVTLKNSMSGGTYEYKDVYKGINCTK